MVDLLTPRRGKTLAVIGTAGRGADGTKLTPFHWTAMVAAAYEVALSEKVTDLVSGGAAWADHVAVAMSGSFPVKLYIPEWERDLDIAAFYHRRFSGVIKEDTWSQVHAVSNIVNHRGFKDRNTLVARDADVSIAMTFGDGPNVKDGGTADTVRKMACPGYHFDLNNLSLHTIA